MRAELMAFSAADFRRRVLEDGEGVAEREDRDARDIGDHILNPSVRLSGEGIRLKDAAVLVPVIDDGDEARVIFTQRTKTLRNHSGQISFPGGGIDAQDRSPEEAALRETEEEIGMSRRFVETVGRMPDYISGTGFRIKPVLAVVRRGFTLTPNPAEVDEVFEVPLSFLMNPANHSRGSRMFQGRERFFYEMPYGERYIWGITAGIVRSIYERFYS
ncbi:CoA pyrophosphatase [Rhizobium rhizogenes]|uniref:CoA pyrophosphatase n=1 Tax=Rhizobium rhizogenes TaxID=359 RepID=A0AA92C6I7_RHIRH|nr:CoA pyrophosphatase [Rhizobium rhizogenes]PVE56874.1 CoA pyrophosphatase [Rhizobium rhizogenes]PVE68615.1 CoA pyrophosphatase [Agrobacterium tumefaciens]PVE78363.1 CoA pyrophosphatase [Sphingomonas sp. TPD3009]